MTLAHCQRDSVLVQLRTLFGVGTVAGLSDGQLLERFVAGHGEAAELAFSVLLERHGPMVLRVCRRLLADPHDAQDAFQATFLVLVKKARSIRECESVASWLHGVALRAAACARAAAARRRRHERRRAEMATTEVDAATPTEAAEAVHQEVDRLPKPYRCAVVLCYFEGRTYEEAANALQCPVGTVKSRLAWSRDRLRARLASRGLAPSGAVFAALLSSESSSAAVPEALADATIEAAMQLAASPAAAAGLVPASVAALTEGVTKAMLLSKWKLIVMSLTVAGVVGSSAAVLAQLPKGAEGDPNASAAGFGARDPARDDSGRLEAIERKLDRLMERLGDRAMEKAEGKAPPRADIGAGFGSGSGGGFGFGGGRGSNKPTPKDMKPSDQPKSAASADYAPQPKGASRSDRLDHFERRLDQLERRLERLESRPTASP
jgi:RNA polymerase sigma factor (sigma-70 family)